MALARLAIGIVLIVLVGVLGGCVRSKTPLIDSMVAVQPLFEQTLAKSEQNLFALRASGSGYAVDVASLALEDVQFMPLPEADGFYVVQVLDAGDYVYALASIGAGTLNLYNFKDMDLAQEIGFLPPGAKDALQVDVGSLDGVKRFFAGAYEHRGEAAVETYRLFDRAGPEKSEAGRLIAAYQEQHRAPAAAASTEPTKSSVRTIGNWDFGRLVDPMTDVTTFVLLGHPESMQGVTGNAYLQVMCGTDGVTIGMAWGETQLADMYPDSDLDFADVIMRFDDSSPFRFGWEMTSGATLIVSPVKEDGSLAQLQQGLASMFFADSGKISMVWEAKPLHNRLADAHRMIARAETADGRAGTLVFDLTGYAQLAQEFPDYCNS